MRELKTLCNERTPGWRAGKSAAYSTNERKTHAHTKR